MFEQTPVQKLTAALAVILGLAFSLPASVLAHCDTVDGPVVTDAREALAAGKVNPVLKWVAREHEQEVESVFRHALSVRQLGDAARELADRHFFETVVRLHREGEGFGYTGLKAGGSSVSPAILAADAALESGSEDALVEEITAGIAEGMRRRFEHARETRRHADESVTAGREFVSAYVEFTHYVEASEALADGHPAAHEAPLRHDEREPGH